MFVLTHWRVLVLTLAVSLGPRPNQPQHGSLLVSRAGKESCIILEAIHALDKRSGNETNSQYACIIIVWSGDVCWSQRL